MEAVIEERFPRQRAPAVDDFFADVMVMDPNPELRDNRLALLQQLHQKMNLVADLGKLA